MRASLFVARPQALRPSAFLRPSECPYSLWLQADPDSGLRAALVAGSASGVEVVRPGRSQRYRCSWVVPVALSLLSAADLVYLFESEAVRSQPRESESIAPAVLVPFSEVGLE